MGIDLYNLVISAKLQKGGGGGGDIDVDSLTVTENGTYSASSGHAFDPVVVSVPTGVFPSGTKDIASNGIYDVESFKSASVNVPQPSGTSSITANGIYDITNFASVDVNVSGGGGDHDAEDGIIQRTISGAYTNSRATKIGSFAFCGCGNLTDANFPNVTTISSNAFIGCGRLSEVSFPNVKTISSNAFSGCYSLPTVSFPSVSTIGNSAFYGCEKLMSLYFLASSVVSLTGTSTFINTPLAKSTYTGSFGSIYVPASLVDSYKSATRWSTYADRITSYVE